MLPHTMHIKTLKYCTGAGFLPSRERGDVSRCRVHVGSTSGPQGCGVASRETDTGSARHGRGWGTSGIQVQDPPQVPAQPRAHRDPLCRPWGGGATAPHSFPSPRPLLWPSPCPGLGSPRGRLSLAMAGAALLAPAGDLVQSPGAAGVLTSHTVFLSSFN